MKSKLWKALVALLIVLLASTGAMAKSLYVITDHHAGTFWAYNIWPNGTISPQASYTIPNYGLGPSGVAIDLDTEVIFITYENSNRVALVDARTMTSIGSATAPGASDLAGIDVDSVSDIVYTVNRGTNKLYIYSWDPNTQTLTLQSAQQLTGNPSIWGVALDESRGILWVSSNDGRIIGYNVSTWNIVQTFTPSQTPCGIAVDTIRGKIYSVAPDGTCAYAPTGNNTLVVVDISSGTETSVPLGGYGGMGIAVDEATGYIYLTTGCSGDTIQVWAPNLTKIQETGDVGNPAGIVVGPGYNPLNLSKDDGVTEVLPGQQLTYTICYSNTNPSDVTNVTLIDQLPSIASFVSAPGGVYDQNTHMVTWNVGTLQSGQQECRYLTVRVDSNAQPCTWFTNYVTITSDQTPPSTQTDTDHVKLPPSVPEFPPFTVAILGLLGAVLLLRRMAS